MLQFLKISLAAARILALRRFLLKVTLPLRYLAYPTASSILGLDGKA